MPRQIAPISLPAAPAKPKAPAPRGRLVTLADGARGLDAAALTESIIRRQGVYDVFTRGNPSEWRQDITAQNSASGALGYYSLASPRFYDLLDEMREKCPIIDGTLELITATIMGREFRVEAPQGSGDAGAKIAAEVQRMILEPKPMPGAEHLADFGFEHLLSTATIGALLHGFSVNETMWNAGTGRGMVEPSHYYHAHPGQFVFRQDGALSLYVAGNEPAAPPPDKFILARLPGLYSNPYGRSAIFSLRYHYHFWKEILKAWAENVTLYGTPLAIGKISAEGIGEGTDAEKEHDDLMAIIAGFRRDVGAVLSAAQTVEFQDRMAGRGESPHKALVDYFERGMVRRLLGAVLQVMESEYGSRAASDTHAGVQTLRLKPLAAIVANSITRGLIRPLVRFNWGPNAPVPQAVIDMDDAVDVEQIMKTIAVAEKTGFTISLDQIRDWTGLRAPIDDEDALNPAATSKQVYQYHIVAGVVTVNEIRLSLGFEPMVGGDVPVDPMRFAISEAQGAAVSLSRERAEEIVMLAASDIRRSRAKALADFQDAVAREAMKADKAAARKAIEKGLAKLAKEFPGDAKMTAAAARVASGAADFASMGAGLELAMGAAKAKAMMEVFKAAGKVVETVTPADTAKAYAPYKKAVDWMLDRKLMKASDLEALAESIATISPGLKVKDVAGALREEVLALKDSIPLEAAARFKRHLAAGVNNGSTVNDFVEAARADLAIAPDASVGGVDAYLENVYRTETGNAYARQQDANLSSEAVSPFLWGREVHNPDDDRSRPSHAAADGLIVKAGSAADKALGNSPFSYQCRCVVSPIIEANPAKSKLQESPDAMARIAKIERF